MRKVFDLYGTLTILGFGDVARQLTDIEKQAASFSKNIGAVGSSVAKLGFTFSKLVSGPLLSASYGLEKLINKSSSYYDNISDMSRITGVSTDALQKFAYATKVLGVDTDIVFQKLIKLNKNNGELSAGSTELGAVYAKLGLNIRDTNGSLKTADKIFLELITKLGKVENVGIRTSLMSKIFGKNFSQVAEIINGVDGEFERLMSYVEESGLMLSNDLVNSAADSKDAIGELKAVIELLTLIIGAKLAPVLTKTIIPILKVQLFPVILKLSRLIEDYSKKFASLSPGMKEWIVKIIECAAVLGPMLYVTGKLIKNIRELSIVLALAKVAVTGFMIAINLNPFILATTAITGLVLTLGSLSKKYDEINKKRLGPIITPDKAQINSFIDRVDVLVKKAREHKQEMGNEGDAARLLGDDFVKLSKLARQYGYEVLNGNAAGLGSLEIAAKRLSLLEKTQVVASETAETEQENLDLGEEAALTELEMREMRKALDKENLDSIRKEMLTELEMLDYKEKEEIKIATKAEGDISLIQQKYALERDKLLVAEYEKKMALMAKEKEENEKLQQEFFNREVEIAEKKQRILNDIYSLGVSFAKNIFSEMFSAKNILLDNSHKKEIELINSSTLSEQGKKDAITKLDLEHDKKKKELQRKQAMYDKATAMFNISNSTLVAIMKAWELGPVGAIMAVAIGILGALNLAAVASRPLPLAGGALIRKRNKGVVAQIGEGNDDETVLPMKLGAKELVNNMMAPIIGAILTTGMGFLDAFKLVNKPLPSGGIANKNKISTQDMVNDVVGTIGNIKNPNFSHEVVAGGGVEKNNETHWHIGTLIADDSGIRELERRQRKIRLNENLRLGI